MRDFHSIRQMLILDGFDLSVYKSISNCNLEDWMHNIQYRLQVDIYLENDQHQEAVELNKALMKKGDTSSALTRSSDKKNDPLGFFSSIQTVDEDSLSIYAAKDVKIRKSLSYVHSVAVVNLHRTDAELVEEFREWLGRERMVRSITPARSPSKAKLRKLYQHKVLPYIDILQWCVLNDCKLTNGQIGELLFPEHDEGNNAELVRKHTKPHTKYIFEKIATTCIFSTILKA